jgi:hypothetical protein
MSKTFKRHPHKQFKHHPHRMYKQNSVEPHDGYRPRARHGSSNAVLVSAWDDVWKGATADKWVSDPGRNQKLQNRKLR